MRQNRVLGVDVSAKANGLQVKAPTKVEGIVVRRRSTSLDYDRVRCRRLDGSYVRRHVPDRFGIIRSGRAQAEYIDEHDISIGPLHTKNYMRSPNAHADAMRRWS